MSDDFDYEQAPEAGGITKRKRSHEYDFEYDPYDHYDEDIEIEKAERDYERYIGRS